MSISLSITVNILLNNYTWIKGRRTTSCAAKPFWIAKPNLWKTTFIDLGDITWLRMTFWKFKTFMYGVTTTKCGTDRAL
jgi:hypothetical protein